MLEVATVLLAIACTLAYFYFTRTFHYWRDKGIAFVKPYPLVGSMWRQITLQEHMSEFFRRVYFDYPDEPYVGFYQGFIASLIIRDKELIKNIITKDYSYFNDHGMKFSEEADPLCAKALFNMRGQSWKDMRIMLAPTFTSGRMKAMFPLVSECAEGFQTYLKQNVISGKDFELKDLLARYTTNVIASSVFGVICDSFNEPQNTFHLMSHKMVETDIIQGIKVALITLIPGIGNLIKISFFKPEFEQYFRNLMKNIISLRQGNEGKKKDFMELLLQLREKGWLTVNHEDEIHNISNINEIYNNNEKRKLTEIEVMAQALGFCFAGFETSSSAMAFALFELSRRPDLQHVARQHIEEVLQRHDGRISYQALQEMTYLNWILQETLRKYPPIVLFRRCIKNYKIPGSKFIIEKGTPLIIPTYGLHYDPQYYTDPEKFIPERFGDEDLIKRNQYVYLPFGEGPRLCLGKRFAMMQAKLALLTILQNFEITPSKKTDFPLSMDPRFLQLTAKDGLFVNINPLS